MNKFGYSFLIKNISVLMVLILLFSVMSVGASAERDFQAEIDALEDKIDANNSSASNNKKTREQLNSEVQNLQQQIDIYNEKISSLDKQIDEKNATINKYNDEINALNGEIAQTNTEIDGLNKQIDEAYDLLKERLRASYMAGETSTLEMLMGASDYESFLTRLELLSSVARHDQNLIDGLEGDIDELNDLVASLDVKKKQQEEKKSAIEVQRNEIQSVKTEQVEARNSLDQKQSQIESKVQSINSILAKLDSSSAEYRAQQEKIRAEQAAYDVAKTGGMSAGSGSLGAGGGTSNIGSYPVSGRGMICPLQYGNVYVSQHYGHNGHKGVDLCTSGSGSTMGKEIRAAASGTVYSAEYHYSWGNNVYINHGNGVYTRYAHCSRMIVSPGQQVQQGQVIAYAGNTGNSFGAHLHFEVWINGSRVNPEPYFNLP